MRCPTMRWAAVSLAMLAAVAAGCLGVMGPSAPDTPAMEPSPDQALFEQDPDWLGGDGAQSIALAEDRILWLFGDSFVRADDGSERFVHNTVAIQEGTDPAQASFDAAWGTETVEEDDGGLPDPTSEDEPGERPTAFFPNESSEIFHWPAAPALVDGELYVFANRVRDTGEGPFGFEAAGWRVFAVDGHEGPPERWSLQRIDPDVEDHGYTVGIAALVEDGHLYAYGHRADDGGELQVHEVALFRWSVEDVSQGRWDRAERWTGERFASEGEPAVLFETLAASFTTHRVGERILFTAMDGIGTGTVTLRAAEQPQGPFTEPVDLYQPERAEDEEHFHYAARLHPELDGERVVTWHDSRFRTPRMAHAVG